MLQLHGHGTLVVAQYVSSRFPTPSNDGIAIASDRQQDIENVDGTNLSKPKVRKLFRVDRRTVCALGDLSGCTGPDEKWIDFSDAIETGILHVTELRNLLFEDKCELIASELDDLLQTLPDVVARYPRQTVSTLFFFGYQGRGARFGFCEFVHEIGNKKVDSISGDQIVAGSELWVFGPQETIEAKLARMGVGFRMVGKALVSPVPISSLTEAASFVRALVSDSIKDMPQELGGPPQVATIPRNPRWNPIFSE